jgi:hypothetical protein
VPQVVPTVMRRRACARRNWQDFQVVKSMEFLRVRNVNVRDTTHHTPPLVLAVCGTGGSARRRPQECLYEYSVCVCGEC